MTWCPETILSVKMKNPIRMLLLVLLSAGVTTWLDHAQFFSRVETASFDHRVALFRSNESIHDDVVVILIDDESLQTMNSRLGRWPWPRDAFADILDFFSSAGAQALAFDILFTEHEAGAGINARDRRLVDATRNSEIAVHAMQLLHSRLTGNHRELPPEFVDRFALNAGDFVGRDYGDYLLPFPELLRATMAIGFLEIRPDRDGVYRRIRLFNRHTDGTVLPSLASATVLRVLGGGNTIVNAGRQATIGSLEIPLDGHGNYLVNPYGEVRAYPVSSVFRVMEQVRAGQTENLALDPRLFDGKLVLLGASAIGLLDVKSTALAEAEAGVFLHAYAISNILEQDFLNSASTALELCLVFGISALAVVSALFTTRAVIALLIHAVLALGYAGCAYFAFSLNQVLPIWPVLFAFFLSLLSAYFVRAYDKKR